MLRAKSELLMENVVRRLLRLLRRCSMSKLVSEKNRPNSSVTAVSVKDGMPRIAARRTMPETSFSRSAALSGLRSPLR